MALSHHRDLSFENQLELKQNKKYKTLLLADKQHATLSDGQSQSSNLDLVTDLLLKLVVKAKNVPFPP